MSGYLLSIEVRRCDSDGGGVGEIVALEQAICTDLPDVFVELRVCGERLRTASRFSGGGLLERAIEADVRPKAGG